MTTPEIESIIAKHLVLALKKVLHATTSQEYEVSSGSVGDPSTAEGRDQRWTWWSQEFSLLPQPGLWVGATGEAWEALGGAVLAALGVENASSQDSQSTARDIVAQATAALAQKLAKDYGTELTVRDLAASGAPSGVPVNFQIGAAGAVDAIELGVVFNAALLGELARLSKPPDPDPGPVASSPRGTPGPKGTALPKSIGDLHLDLRVILGRTTLPLERILKLNVGSLIDLGQSASDLVDVVVNGKTIASGQLVACNGNYAVQVMPPDLDEA